MIVHETVPGGRHGDIWLRPTITPAPRRWNCDLALSVNRDLVRPGASVVTDCPVDEADHEVPGSDRAEQGRSLLHALARCVPPRRHEHDERETSAIPPSCILPTPRPHWSPTVPSLPGSATQVESAPAGDGATGWDAGCRRGRRSRPCCCSYRAHRGAGALPTGWNADTGAWAAEPSTSEFVTSPSPLSPRATRRARGRRLLRPQPAPI